MDDPVVQSSIQKFVFPDQVSGNSYDCCLVFGSAHSQSHLASKAAALYRSAKCLRFIVSGHAGEAAAIGTAKQALGVPSGAIELESNASNTLENVKNAKPFIMQSIKRGKQRIIIVCKNYAARRSLLTVQKHIQVTEIAVETIDLHNVDNSNFLSSKLFMKKMLSEVEKIILYSQRGDICHYNATGQSDINQIHSYLLNKTKSSEKSRKY